MNTSRQLAAILFADIEGYTALMQQNEAKAISLRDKFQRIIEEEVRIRGGRVAEFSGDGALCVFNSAIEAVRAAISIQSRMRSAPTVPLRIGLHTGDVITEGKNVFGDGVNLASRIQSFAVPGSVLISEKVYDEIKNQEDISVVPLGTFELKNVSNPVNIYAIRHESLIIPKKAGLKGKGNQVSKRKAPLWKLATIASAVIVLIAVSAFFFLKKGKPLTTSQVTPHYKTIAVLPFSNLSGQKEDDYFSDGICDEILTRLSKISQLNVLSRTSTLQFRDTKKTIKEIGLQIGADVLLEGSVQKSKDKVRINVQLIDATTDKHLWAETYDRELKDVFSIQSDIAQQIAEALNTTFTKYEADLLTENPTENLEAFDAYLKGNNYSSDFWDMTKMEKVPDAIAMYEKAIRLDPKFLDPYAGLVELYTEIAWRKEVINSADYRKKAKEWLDKMIALKIDHPLVHRTIAMYKYEGERDYEGALEELNKIDRYFHSDKHTYSLREYILRRMGRLEEALKLFIRSAEAYPKIGYVQSEVAETYAVLRNADSAIYYFDKAIKLQPDNPLFYSSKAGIYSDLKGDFNTSAAILKSAIPFTDTSEFNEDYIYFEMLRGNYDNAIQRILKRKDELYRLRQSMITPHSTLIGYLYTVKGDKDQARIYFQKSLDIMTAFINKYPDDFRAHAAVGIAYAGLGERDKAIAEGNKARSMMPLSMDAIVGLGPLESLATIYTLLGEQDAAIDILEQLLKQSFGWGTTNTIPLYKTFPVWKLLHNNPRFQKIIQ